MVIKRRGQALIELLLGMMAGALVIGALVAFTHYIAVSLNEQRTLRASAGRGALSQQGGDESYSSAVRHRTVSVPPIAADHIFGSGEVTVIEEAHIPVTGIQPQEMNIP